MKIQLYKLKSAIRVGLQKITSIFLPEIRISQKFTYDLLGHEDGHYFIGYYDKDPIDHFGKYTLCHKVPFKYENMIEPKSAEIGLLSLNDNIFHQLVVTKAMNWQLGSRVQWLSQDTIIYNDIVKGEQCSIKFNTSTKEKLFIYKRSFWDISPDKKFGASLNFSRIKVMRPGYGYNGNNTDGDKDVLTVFSLDNDKLIYEIGLDEIIKTVNYENLKNEDIYLNHIVWSPCSTKLMTIFHYEDKSKGRRMIFPVLIDINTKTIDLIFEDGYFSHHTFIDKNRILAYIRLNNKYCFAIWSKDHGWIAIKDSMPELDGHPTYINSTNRILVDSYPNRLGIMSLYLGSPDNGNKLDRIAYVVNNPKYRGPLRCDLHPRVSNKHKLIACDIPHKNGRKILIIKGALNG
jgi:hypothetical protein